MLIIFGSQWMPSVPVFRILSLSVGVQIVLASSGGIFQAANDTRSLFCQRGVFGDAQRGWHSGRDFRFSIVGGGRMVHLRDVYDQFRAVLLDDVPGDVREKPPVGVLPTARFAAGGKRDTRAVAGSDDGLTKSFPELVWHPGERGRFFTNFVCIPAG